MGSQRYSKISRERSPRKWFGGSTTDVPAEIIRCGHENISNIQDFENIGVEKAPLIEPGHENIQNIQEKDFENIGAAKALLLEPLQPAEIIRSVNELERRSPLPAASKLVSPAADEPDDDSDFLNIPFDEIFFKEFEELDECIQDSPPLLKKARHF